MFLAPVVRHAAVQLQQPALAGGLVRQHGERSAGVVGCELEELVVVQRDVLLHRQVREQAVGERAVRRLHALRDPVGEVTLALARADDGCLVEQVELTEPVRGLGIEARPGRELGQQGSPVGQARRLPGPRAREDDELTPPRSGREGFRRGCQVRQLRIDTALEGAPASHGLQRSPVGLAMRDDHEVGARALALLLERREQSVEVACPARSPGTAPSADQGHGEQAPGALPQVARRLERHCDVDELAQRLPVVPPVVGAAVGDGSENRSSAPLVRQHERQDPGAVLPPVVRQLAGAARHSGLEFRVLLEPVLGDEGPEVTRQVPGVAGQVPEVASYGQDCHVAPSLGRSGSQTDTRFLHPPPYGRRR